MSGIVRAHTAAKEQGLKLLVERQFRVDWGIAALPETTPFELTVLACNLHGYGNLCQFITKLRRAAPKGFYTPTYPTSPAPNSTTAWSSPRRRAWPSRLS